MTAALEGMLFEQNQITNYLKQSKLLQRHQTLSGNKAGKKHQFREAGHYLLWAVGGNMSNPKCGPNDTSSSKYNRYFSPVHDEEIRQGGGIQGLALAIKTKTWQILFLFLKNPPIVD